MHPVNSQVISVIGNHELPKSLILLILFILYQSIVKDEFLIRKCWCDRRSFRKKANISSLFLRELED